MTDIIEIEDGAHSEHGPSAADRWIACPGSVLASRGKPDDPSDYAISGTASHTLSEWCRLQNKRAKEFLGTTIRVKHSMGFTDVKVDEPRVDSVQEFIDRLAEQQGDELVEARVSYAAHIPKGFGTLDAAKLQEHVALITDFKDGEGVKKYAKMNPQLLLYAFGVYLAYSWLYNFQAFKLAICQPRLDHYDAWDIGLEDLLKWVHEVAVPAAKRSLEPGAPFAAGDHCQFCRIRATCRTRAEWVFENVTGVFKDLDSAVESAATAAERRPAEITNDELAKVLKAVPGIKSYLAAIKTHAAKEIMEGRPVGDFKFVDGRSSRQFIVSESTVVEKAAALGVDTAELYTTPELKSVAKIEKIVGPKHFAEAKLNEDGSVKKQAGAMAALVKKTKGKPTLVPGSDRRPAVSVDPTDVFSDLGSTEEE